MCPTWKAPMPPNQQQTPEQPAQDSTQPTRIHGKLKGGRSKGSSIKRVRLTNKKNYLPHYLLLPWYQGGTVAALSRPQWSPGTAGAPLDLPDTQAPQRSS